jgi:endonuclease YncB( thermonuclease family)
MRKRRLRLAPLLLLAAVAVLLSVRDVRGAWSREAQGDGRIEARAEFGLCHEGGGTNCVVDGDTIWIKGEKVRIAGIDAPETHEPKCPREAALGRAAADRLHALLNSGTVTATRADRDRDPNGRLLRNVSVDGRDVGQALIAAGVARRYGGAKKAWC